MFRSRLATRITVAAILGLTGCGSQKSTSSASPSATTAMPATSTAGGSAVPASTTAGQLTPPGTQLKISQPAILAYKDFQHAALKSTIQVTPLSFDKGSASDLKGVRLDASQQGSTPFFVRIRFQNLGTADLSGAYVASRVEGVDDRKQTQSSVTFIGDFPRCNETKAPVGFTHAKTFTTCVTFLIPAGGSLAAVKMLIYDPKTPDKQDVVWTP